MIKKFKEPVVRTKPRISLNKLGEYLTASPARRRRIIKDQKRPPSYQVVRYTDATRAITNYLCKGFDEKILARELARFERHAPDSDYDEQRIELCSEAIEAFMEISEYIDFGDFDPTPGDHEPPYLTVAGVDISVRPDVLLLGKDRNGASRVGLFKLYVSKSHPLDEASGQYITACMQAFADEHLAEHGTSLHRQIQVVDIFTGDVYTAPKAATRRLSDIEAACEEISARWALL